MSKFLFKDSLVIESSLPDNIKKDASEMLRRDRGAKLFVEIDATHSGTLINGRVYPGTQVVNGYKSFFSTDKGGTAAYDKPILRHHDSFSDAIGRVTGAKYTQLKFGDQFENDWLAPEVAGTKGSGIVTVSGFITDSDAIQKIIDSRYLSVSAGHSSQRILCSTCGDSILDCPHMPGMSYNEEGEPVDSESGLMCYAITQGMTYNEVSFVNQPASAQAKIKSHTWADSKSSWTKDTVFASEVSGKKEAVRNFVLRDEDGDLSLLNGTHKAANKKTVIAVSPAITDKLKQVMSSDKSSNTDETSNVRKVETGPESGASIVEQNLDKANLDQKSKEDSNMEKELEVLKTEIASLKDAVSASKTEVETLKKQNEAKDSQIQRLTTDAATMQAKMGKTLAVSLASLRSRLNKTAKDSVDTKEKFDAYVEKLSARSIDSLQDSLQDLMQELDGLELPNKKQEGVVNQLATGDKVSSPVLTKSTSGKPEEKPADKNKKSTASAVDKLDTELGLKGK